MAATPTSNYSSSPSPSPSPSTHIPAEWEIRSQWRFCPTGEETYIPLHRTPSPQPSTQTPRQSSSEKRHKKMADIAKNVDSESVAFAWMFMGIYARKSSVAETLRTGFNLKPSLKEVFEIQSEIETEFKKAMRGLINHGSYYKGSGSKFCFINFMRDMMEIPELAMIRMRRVLAECKCCAHHQSRRPLCQEKKRRPDYDIFAQPENDCQCSCRHFARKLEEALLGDYPLEVNGQLWERSL